MRDEEAAQLLEFIRHEVIPLLLSEAVPGGVDTMVRRLKLEYPGLDLFSKSAASMSHADILLVENDSDLLHLLTTALTGKGYSVAVAHDADEALLRLQLDTPRAILVDHRLPLIDATQFRERQLAADISPEVPVVMFSNEPVRTTGLKFAAVVVSGVLLDGVLNALAAVL